MKVIHDGNPIPLTVSNCEPDLEDRGTIVTAITSDNTETIEIRLPFFDCDHTKVIRGSYYVEALQTPEPRSHRSKEIRVNSDGDGQKRIGQIFPIWEICNDESGFHENANEFVSAYALAGILSIINSENILNTTKEIFFGEIYNIEYFIDNEIVLLVFDKDSNAHISFERLRANNEQELVHNSIPSLAKKGLFELKAGTPVVTESTRASQEDYNAFYIEEHSKILPDEAFHFLTNFITHYDCASYDPIVKFFIQYQFFEILINYIFEELINEFKAKITEFDTNSSAVDSKNFIDKVNQKSSESSRISKLFDCFDNQCLETTSALREECIYFIRDIEPNGFFVKSDKKPEDMNAAELFYKVRNAIFHGFGMYSIDKEKITPICEKTFSLIYDIATNINKPNSFFE